MANAQAYLDAGGSANWTLIPFKHNEHTIDKCEELANKMGFSQFKVKKTYRVGNNDSTSQPIELPTNKKYINEYVHKNINRDINCKARNEDEIYISADGDVAPCCWTGSNLWQEKYKNPKSPKSPSVENNYFVDFDNNFRTNKLSNIIDSYIDKTDQYEVAWECKAFAVCNKSCGTSKWLDRYQDRS